MTISELLRNCRQAFAQVELRYAHPSLYVICISELFAGLDPEGRELVLLEKIDSDALELGELQSATGISVELCTQEERAKSLGFLEHADSSPHWLLLLDEEVRRNLEPAPASPIPCVHFYGFKGGQARSTVLAMAAKSFAADGYKVLVVDLDLEAPSLDRMFDVAALDVSSTFMGLCGWSKEFSTVGVLRSTSSSGSIDLLPCRPADSSFDMDFAAFTVRAALDISTINKGLRNLKSRVASSVPAMYDIVLFDHRTGIAPSILPAIRVWRGPVAISVRADGLSTQATGAFASLFAQNPDNPGAFVCFSLDPEDAQDTVIQRAPKQVQSLLGELSDAIARGAEDEARNERLPPDELLGYWVPWFFDRALLNELSPNLERLSPQNLASLRQLREVLGLQGKPSTARDVALAPDVRVRSPSGAIDAGWFIETPEITRLFSHNSAWNYIVGRKGTGKTRIYKEMVARGLGEPLFAAADFSGGGLKSQSPPYSQLLNACDGDFKQFWWALLDIALALPETASAVPFNNTIEAWTVRPADRRKADATAHAVFRRTSTMSARRYFLVDGIETAVPAAQLRLFIEELLLFMLTIQSDSKFSNHIGIRLFLRTDLLRNATQNIEQQTSQRKLELRWDSDAIFNFVLARIEQLEWFNQRFAASCDRIRQHKDEIRSGKLARAVYEPLLLSIFPQKLRRNNIQTMTFLDTYFSDGDSQAGASFYPRLFENFLFQVTEVAKNAATYAGGRAIENDRISHAVVLDAHAAASSAFIEEVTHELYSLLNLNGDDTQNRRLVDRLISTFEGQATPFEIEQLLRGLQASIAELDGSQLRDALQRMKDIGIFEGRPGYPGQWRAGRLYKSALRMKYVR